MARNVGHKNGGRPLKRMALCQLSYIALNLYTYVMRRACNNSAILLVFSFNTRPACRIIFTKDDLVEYKISPELFQGFAETRRSAFLISIIRSLVYNHRNFVINSG